MIHPLNVYNSVGCFEYSELCNPRHSLFCLHHLKKNSRTHEQSLLASPHPAFPSRPLAITDSSYFD